MRKLRNEAAICRGIASFLGLPKSATPGSQRGRMGHLLASVSRLAGLAVTRIALVSMAAISLLAARAQTIEFLPSAPSVYENGGAAGTNVTIVITRNPAAGDSSVNLSTVDGTAFSLSDYVGTNITVNFTNGEGFKVISIGVIDDLLAEGTEQFTAVLSSPTGGTLGSVTNQVVTIFDNDTTFRFIPTTNVTVLEDQTNAVLVVERVGDTSGSASVDFFTSDGTALSAPVAFADFTAASGTLVFTNGQVTNIIRVPIIDDCRVEPAERFEVELTNPVGGTVSTLAGVSTVSITDNDNAVGTIEFGTIALNSGPPVDQGLPLVYEHLTRTITVRVNRRRACDTNNTPIAFTGNAVVNVNVGFAGLCPGTDVAQEGLDYTVSRRQISFGGDSVREEFTITIIDDGFIEIDEGIILGLEIDDSSSPRPALGANRGKIIWIRSDDLPAGGVDPYYNPLSLLNPTPGANNSVYAVAAVNDVGNPNYGSVYLGGDFTAVNAVVRNRVARLDVFGLVDESFDPGSGADGFVQAILVQPDGKVLIAGGFTSVDNRSRNGVARLNSDGTLDETFNPGAGANGPVLAMKLESNGQVIIAGDFTAYNDVPRIRIARLNANGTLDTSFDPGAGADGPIWALESLTPPPACEPPPIARVTFDSLPPDFLEVTNHTENCVRMFGPTGGHFHRTTNPGNNTTAAAIFGDGTPQQIDVNGRVFSLASLNIVSMSGTIRVTNSAGGNVVLSGTGTFNFGASFSNITWALIVLESGTITIDDVVVLPAPIPPPPPSGTLVIGGEFTSYNGVTRNRIARLLATGALDASFAPLSGANETIYSVTTEPGGLIYVGGAFTSYDGQPRNGIARLMPNGLLDTVFRPGAGSDGVVYQVRLQANGRPIIVGDFSSYNSTPRAGLARLYPDGTLDTSFLDIHYSQTQPGVNGFINALDLFANTNVIIGGSFSVVGGGVDGFGGMATNAVTPKFNFAQVMGHLNPEAFNMPGNVRFVSATYSIDENVLGGLLTVTVERVNGRYGPLQVSYFTENGTARAGSDFVAVSNSIVWSDCELSTRTFSIPILDNSAIQGNRTFSVRLTDPVSIGGVAPAYPALGAQAQATVTIVDNDFARGAIGFSQPVFSVAENGGTAQIVVTRTNGSVGAVTVDYATYNSRATAGTDFTAKSGTLMFGSGVTTQTITINITDDTASENEEWFGVRLTNVTGGATLALSNATVLIIDNEASSRGSVSFASTSYSIAESNAFANILLRRTSGVLGTVAVNVVTFDFPPGAGNARSNVDYTAVATNVVFAPGVVTQLVTIPILNDSFVEGNEQLGLALELVTGGTLGFQSNAVLNIIEDDSYGVLSFADVSYFINERATNLVVNVARTGGDAEEVSVDFTVSALTAIDGVDYIGTNGTLTFPNGVRHASFVIPILNDSELETNETLSISLGNFQKAGAGPFTSALVTIIDDEALDVPAGTVDTTFNAHPDGFVNALGLQSDGKLIIGGDFTTVDGFPFNRVARLSIAGTVDTLFTPGDGANGKVHALVVQPDDKILVAGRFSRFNTTNHVGITRLNANGTVDSSFNPGAGADNPVFALALTAHGKVVLGGSFTTVNGVNRPNVAVLNTNGTVDAGFDTGAGLNGTVYAVAVQPDGRILVGGEFTLVNNTNRTRIARLNANGSLDLSFNPGAGPGAAVRAIVVQPDGKIVIGGSFTNVGATAANYVARLNENGTIDAGFNIGSGADAPVLALTRQADGKIVAVGDFRVFNGVSRNRITRLNADGSIDPTINFGTGANSFIAAVLVQPNEEINIGGGFTQFNGVPRDYVARLVGGENAGAGEIGFLGATFFVDENGTNALITVQRNGGTAGSVDAYFTTVDGIDFPPFVAATAPDDYATTNGTLTFPHGETLKTFKVRINNSTQVEGDKLLFLSLSGATGGAVIDAGRADAALVILEDDSILSFTSPSFSVNEGVFSGHASITVTRGGSTNTAVSTYVATVGGTAADGADFIADVQLLVFAPGEVLKVFTFGIVNDTLVEGAETVDVALTVPSVVNRPDASVSLGLAATTLTIVDNDFLPGVFTFAIGTNSVAEGAGSATVTVVRTNGSSGIVSVGYSIAGISATAGEDFLGELTGTVSFADGETTNSFLIPIVNDVFLEGDELLRINLANPQGGASIGPLSSHDLIIVDDDFIGFATNIFTVNESDGAATITVLRTGNTNLAFTVDFAATNGTAIAPGDYFQTNGTLSFAPGELAKTFEVRVLDDALVEPVETVTLLLSNASANVDLRGAITATLQVIDSTKTVSFATNAFFVTESNATGAVIVTRGGNLSGGITVTLSTHDFTAANGYDYNGFTNLLTFTNGEVSKVVLVPVLEDTVPEFTEMITLRLGVPGTAYIAAPEVAALHIIDNDLGPGMPDGTFDPGAGASRFVRALAVQPDGRLLVGGAFTNFANTNLNFLARLHTNGAVDASFVLSSVATNGLTNGFGPNALVSGISVSPSGHIAVGGAFSNYNGAAFNRLVRLTSNGVPDVSFNQPLAFDASVNAVAAQSDGKIVAGGGFKTPVGGVARIRVNATLDLQFDSGGGTESPVNAVALQSDGKVIIGGAFTNVGGFNYSRLARLGSNGVVDATFMPLTIATGNVFAVALAPGGKILIGGNFRQVNGEPRSGVARLHGDGSLDYTFNPGTGVTGTVYTVAALANGSVFIGGDFTAVNGAPRGRYALLHGNGTLDSAFDSSVGADNIVFASVVTPDQKIYIGGDFTTVGGVPRRGVARLNLGEPSPIRVSGPTIVSNAARVMATTAPGTAYVLEGSSDLIYWLSLSTNVATGTLSELTDPENVSGNSLRFYRVRRFGP